MITLTKLRDHREKLRHVLSEGELPKVLNQGQLDEILPVLSTEYLYASGILTSEGYSEQAMFGYVMCLQHVREILSGLTPGTQLIDPDSSLFTNRGDEYVL